MSYTPISVKEVLWQINDENNGWFLPSIQRPFVWGSRYEHEKYICRLFDSLLRLYPIGILILWKAETKVAYREFLKNYNTGQHPEKNVDESKWGKKNKFLVYDGQQRLQALFTCLNYRYNNKVLTFNLLCNYKDDDPDSENIGFSFLSEEERSKLEQYFLPMPELFSQIPDQKVDFRRSLLARCKELTQDQAKLLEENLDDLWSIFVQTDKQLLAYYSVTHSDSSKVNEIFERLNTGGIPLTQADLLFSQLKQTHPNFEEKLADFSDDLFSASKSGFRFTTYGILQVLFLLVKGTTRVDPDQMAKKEEKEKFFSLWEGLKDPLMSFFKDYIHERFGINHNSIVPRQLALLPMIIYFYETFQKGINYRQFPSNFLTDIDKYFILSQINDWNTQGIVDGAARLVREAAKSSDTLFKFPLSAIQQFAAQKNRVTDLTEDTFADNIWFALKVLTPKRVYHFPSETSKRFKPQIDHVFPRKLNSQSKEYYDEVESIWNMQPVDGEINNFKRRRHPKEFFLSEEGKKYLDRYDLLPSKNPDDAIWESPLRFINARHVMMIEFLKKNYDMEFVR